MDSGRMGVTLTWPNHEKYLLSPRGADGAPVWVEKDHPAALTVAGSEMTATVGDVNPAASHANNLLFTGDSLDVLKMLTSSADYSPHFGGRVKLAYLDPPFNTGQTFTHYSDAMAKGVWLSFMKQRLLLVRDLLTSDGTVWVHLDDASSHLARFLLDDIFGPECFVADVSWQRKSSGANAGRSIAPIVDHILVYSRHPKSFSANRLPRSAKQSRRYQNPDNDPRGAWTPGDYSQNKTREQSPGCWYPIVRPSDGQEIWPAPHRVWAWTEEHHLRNVADGRVWWGALGETRKPYYKRFESELGGFLPHNWWPYDVVGHNRESKNEIKALFPDVDYFFDTPKPERLLERILHIGSNPGDIVLDVFAGSGTTSAVAHKMSRRWVAAEILPETVATFTLPRLEKVVAGDDPGGITKAVNWTGGGGFVTVTVTPPAHS